MPKNCDEITFSAINEPQPGRKLRDLFEEYWPAYRKWMSRAELIEPAVCAKQLQKHMPELVPIFERLLEMFGGGDDVARFLSLYRPPRIVRACTQAVLFADGAPVLIRNYDHAPHLCDGIVLASKWKKAQVIAVTDCIWGALDGINEHGLVAALAFGGRPVVGDGFSASLIVRYVLQVCRTVSQAREALSRVPVYMPYTFVVCDPSGDHVTAYLSPDRSARFERTPASANHQGRVEWYKYARMCGTEARLARVQDMLKDPDLTVDSAIAEFHRDPIHRKAYAQGSGTLYTSTLYTRPPQMVLSWPTRTSETYSFRGFREREISVRIPP